MVTRRSGASLLHDGLRLAMVVAAVAAMAYQAGTLAASGAWEPANFFSFFTIQSNILGVGVLLACVAVRGPERGRVFEIVRGGATLYMVITGIVFALLLSGLQQELSTHVEWVNTVVHRIMPLALLLDWIVDPPRHRISRRVSLWWVAYPLAYGVYSLIRGSIVDWYPYPFLDADKHGYGGVLLNGVFLLAFMAAASIAVAELGNWLRARRGGRAAVTRPGTAPAPPDPA